MSARREASIDCSSRRGSCGCTSFIQRNVADLGRRASWHAQSGTSLPELMELGGWKSYEMVLRYAHLTPEKLGSVAGRIEGQARNIAANTTPSKNVAKNATLALCRCADVG
jgi:hypothetical protein